MTSYTIENIATQEIIYLRKMGAYGSPEHFQMMGTFKEWLNNQQLNDSIKQTGILGIAWDDPQVVPADQCRYDLALFVGKKEVAIDGLLQKGLFRGGKYAVFTVPHTTEAVADFWQNIHQTIAENQWQRREGPIIERFKEAIGDDQDCEFLIPIA